MWEIGVAVGMLVLILFFTVYLVWAWHPSSEPLAHWRRQRDRKKLIRERLR